MQVFIKGAEVKSKTMEEVVGSTQDKWFHSIGCPRMGIWGDNGTEFANQEMEKLCKKWNISFSAGPPYSQHKYIKIRLNPLQIATGQGSKLQGLDAQEDEENMSQAEQIGKTLEL